LGEKNISIVLGLKPTEIDLIEKREKQVISIIGCRQVGIQFILAFAEAGYRVISNDDDQNLLQLLSKGRTPYFNREIETKIKTNIKKGRITTVSDIKKAVSQSKIVILTTPAKITTRNKLNFSKIERNCKKIGEVLNRKMLFIYGTIANIGFIENNIREILENTSGLKAAKDFGLVYCPLIVTNNSQELFTTRKVTIAGFDKNSLNAAEVLFKSITKNEIKPILDLKKLEAAKLFSIAKKDLITAFSNEIAIFCEKIGLDFFEISKIMSNNIYTNSYQEIGIGLDEKSKFYILLENADNNDVDVKISALARKINEGLNRHSIKLIQKALRMCEKTLRRSRISILGSIGSRTTALDLVKLIERKGAKIKLFDPFMPKKKLYDEKQMYKRSIDEAVEGTDCLVILNNHTKIRGLNFKKLSAIMKKPAAIIDLAGTIKPKKAEKEGFKYSGLGRGAEI
jgi:nucleotide sugar dehydrogenase